MLAPSQPIFRTHHSQFSSFTLLRGFRLTSMYTQLMWAVLPSKTSSQGYTHHSSLTNEATHTPEMARTEKSAQLPTLLYHCRRYIRICVSHRHLFSPSARELSTMHLVSFRWKESEEIVLEEHYTYAIQVYASRAEDEEATT